MPSLVNENRELAQVYQEARDERLAICLANGVDPGDAFRLAHLSGTQAERDFVAWRERQRK